MLSLELREFKTICCGQSNEHEIILSGIRSYNPFKFPSQWLKDEWFTPKKQHTQEINLASLPFDSSMYCSSERYFANILIQLKLAHAGFVLAQPLDFFFFSEIHKLYTSAISIIPIWLILKNAFMSFHCFAVKRLLQ